MRNTCGNSPWCEENERCSCDAWEKYERTFAFMWDDFKFDVGRKIRKVVLKITKWLNTK